MLMAYHEVQESQKKISQEERQAQIKEQAEVYRKRLKKVPWYTEIFKYGRTPFKHDDSWIGWYDIMTLVLLIYVAVVAPFQVAFVPHPTFDVFFIFDRCVDVFFLFDLFFNFMRPIQAGNPARNLRTIRRAYTKPIGASFLPSQFGWDFISTVPYDLISPMIEKNLESWRGKNGLGHLKVIRMIRLMRLIRIAKIIRRNTFFEFYEDKLTVNYASLEMAKLTIVLVGTCHWMACIWAMVPMNLATKYDCTEEPAEYNCDRIDDDGLMDGEIYSWVTALAASKGRSYSHNFDVYLASLHFAVMTLTTVGYGDVSPQTPAEYVVCIALMLFSGIMWAYILGSLTAILSSMDPHGTYFKQTMDDVNYMLKQQNVDSQTACQVRRYWRKTQSVNRLKEYKDLVCMMSPKLQGELEHQIGQHLFDSIPCIQITGMSFVMELCQMTTLCKLLYPPGEQILHRPELHGGFEFVPVGRCLCVVMNPGLVGYGGRVAGAGCQRNYWGEDFLLDNPHLRNEVPACALSFVEIQFIPIEAIDTLLEEPRFHQESITLRSFKVTMATKRGLVAFANLYKKAVVDIIKHDAKNAKLPSVFSLQIETTKSDAASKWRKVEASKSPDKESMSRPSAIDGPASGRTKSERGRRNTKMALMGMGGKGVERSQSPPKLLSPTPDTDKPIHPVGEAASGEMAALTKGIEAITRQLGAMSAWQQEANKKLDLLMGQSSGTPLSTKRGLPPLGAGMMGSSSLQASVGLGLHSAEEPQAKGSPAGAPGRAMSKSTGDLSHFSGLRRSSSRDKEYKMVAGAVAESKTPL